MNTGERFGIKRLVEYVAVVIIGCMLGLAGWAIAYLLMCAIGLCHPAP